MGAVDKIIYNGLMERHTVNVPGVGSLSMVRHKAEKRGHKMAPPLREIVFSANLSEYGMSVIDKIMVIGGISEPKAEQIFASWLSDARKGDSITVEGVGTICGERFVILPELDAKLNPPMPKRRSDWWMWVVLVLLIGGCCYGVWYYWDEVTEYLPKIERSVGISQDEPTAQEVVTVSEEPIDEQQQLPNPSEPSTQEAPEQSTATAEAQPEPTTDAIKTTTTNAVTTGDVVEQPDKGAYYVVVGSYREFANADEKLVSMRGDMGYPQSKIIKSGKGLYLVTIYSSDYATSAEAVLKKVKAFSRTAWVYHAVD